MSEMPKIGDRIRFLGRKVPTQPVPIGTVGIVKSRGRHSFDVLYTWLSENPKTSGHLMKEKPLNHDLKYEGEFWERVTDNSPTIQITVESNKEMHLYVAQSTEVIDGWVGQVKYGSTIVWQSDPVPPTDENDVPISADDQSKEAIKVASQKIEEVVKKQFA